MLSKFDKKYLLEILEKHHKELNVNSIRKCPEDCCWYKKIIKELRLKEKQ